MLKMIEFTKDCGYETRTASVSVMSGFCRVAIEGSRDLYECETDTLEDALTLVKRYGFVEEL